MKPFWKPKEKELFEDKPRYKIRADHHDHSVNIQVFSTLKKGAMVDLYTTMAKSFPGEKKEFDEIETSNSFDLPERFLGLLHAKLTKAYGSIEKEARKDFLEKGKQFRFTVLKTRKCTFTKNDKNGYDVVVTTEGYWSEK